MKPLPSIPPSPSSVLAQPWLAVGLAVAAAHLLLLWAGWHGAGLDEAELALPAGKTYIPVAVLAPPPAPLAGAGPALPRHRAAPPARRPVVRAPVSPVEPPTPPAADAAEATEAAPAAEPPAAPAETPPASTPEPKPEEAEQAPPAAASPAPRAPVQAPASTQLGYAIEGQAKGLNYSASATLDWRQDGQRYEVRMEISAFLIGSRSQTSNGSLGANGLEPERFVDRARKERSTLFDHSAGQFRQEGSDTSLPLPAGTQDRLSVFLQLALQLAALPQPPAPGDSWTIPVAASSSVEQWTFRFAAIDALDLPAGNFQAWRLNRGPRHEGDAEIDLWLAPELAFMPVRIRIRQGNGDSIDQRLSQH